MDLTSLRGLGIALASALIVLALALTILIVPNINIATANSTSSNVAASANVQSYCEIAISNSAVTFNNPSTGQGPGPGTSEYTVNLIVTNTVGNANGNVEILGSAWNGAGTNSFAVGNTFWNAASSGSSTIGNALTTSYVDTVISLPITANSVSSNNIYFGLTIPIGQAAGVYAQNVEFSDTCSASPNTISVNSIFTVNVQSQCGISLSNSAISFGNVNPGSNTPYTSNVETVYNFHGNTAANVLLDGSTWVYNANSFYVSNTVWASSNTQYTSGTSLTLDPGNFVDTGIQEAYPPTNSAANVFFGVAIPPGEPAGVYSQNIVIENKC